MTRQTARGRIVLLCGIALLLALVAVGAMNGRAMPSHRPIRYDVAASNDTVLCVWLDSDFKILGSGCTAPIDVLVTDRRNVPIEGAEIRVEVMGLGRTSEPAPTNVDGITSFVYHVGEVKRQGDVWLVVTASKENYTSGRCSIALTLLPAQIQVSSQGIWIFGLVALVSSGMLGTEVGKYGLMHLLFPLYTRIKKEEVLDHFVRGQIYGFIVAHPGNHYNAIRDALGLNNGTVAHHLKTLELQGFIKSRRDGTYKRFYPIRTKVPQDGGIKFSELQLDIIDLIRQSPDGVTQRALSATLGVTQQTVSYNLRVLQREGVVRFEIDGRRAR
ncbi:MAG: MarR family transcriptional regulator, partial [Candidatus Thermoplasmatota archaeon]